ncbi:MAG: hypothetical protein KGL39_25455 [Patescibacteria group bacterium]|nr:hypothetical protein [Patescibacteria group bacterium]
MTYAEEIKTIAVRSRHAFEELVLDARMTEANKLYSSGRMFAYLRDKYSSKAVAVSKIMASILAAGYSVPIYLEPDEAYQWIREKHKWAIEEMVYEEKIAEAKASFESIKLMLAVLSQFYGTREELLAALRIAANRRRRKTECLN